jgi:hypothetical protein
VLLISVVALPVTERPSVASGCILIGVGFPTGFPSTFHNSESGRTLASPAQEVMAMQMIAIQVDFISMLTRSCSSSARPRAS